jgi:hypothetical protein
MTPFLFPDQVNNSLNGFKRQFCDNPKSVRFDRGPVSLRNRRAVHAFGRGFELPEFQTQLKQYPPGKVVLLARANHVRCPFASAQVT